MWAALSPLVLWLAAIAAYAYEDGMNLFQWMGRFSQVLERPFSIGWTPYTLKCMLVGLLLYGCGIALYYSSRENRRPGEEYGSAKWGNPKELNRKYMDHQHKDANIILTQRVRLGMDGYITQRNMNVLVVGGSGSGKTRFFCKPNIYSVNCSYLITDPKGELLRAAGALLAAQGYEVRVFNLIDPSQSDGYNPFSYIQSEKDVLTLIDNLIKNTTPRNASSNDPFWEKAEIALDSALMLYLVSEAPPEEQNFEMLVYMMNFAEVREEDDQYRSPLDMLFRALEEEQPNHVAVKQFKAFKQAAGKTAKSILVSAAVRLATFNIPQYARMTMVDEMDFGSLGEKKKAIFCVIPVDDSSMNYLVGMLYTQCFQALYRRADAKYNGRLPVPVRVIQDEWANVAQPESYPKILATCRSYNIGLNIIVQNIQQIKALYEKEWEGIIGNCDTLLFLGGGNEPTSLEFIVKLLGNLEQLDQDTEALQAIGRARGCQFNVLRYQQEDALNTVLPLGLKRIDATRTLTTECTAVLMPFKSQEIQDAGGIYYGVNAVSHNLIICNRGNLLNGNGFITGVSGSGKSMAAKQEVSALALSTDHDIIIVDPEREYGELVRALGGEVITISASDPNGCHINALDLSEGYGDGKEPLVMKSEFIMSLYEQLMGADKIEPQEKSIIDRSVGNIYREYLKNYQGQPPTLKDLYDDLMKQVNPEAHRIALALELFTVGSLNVFSHQTNINTKSRILCFDIQDLGENLKSVGLLVMLDAIYNRVIQNRKAGKYTHVYIDEIYLFFANGSGSGRSITNYSSEFLYKCWKRFRKYGATLTGITQNVEECLLSNTARMMFANSEFLLMLNQATTDREQLARLLGASDTQMSYVDNAPAGHGLIKVGGAIVPFANELPKNTELYRLMSTRPGED